MNTCATCQHWQGNESTYAAECGAGYGRPSFDATCGAWSGGDLLTQWTRNAERILLSAERLAAALTPITPEQAAAFDKMVDQLVLDTQWLDNAPDLRAAIDARALEPISEETLLRLAEDARRVLS